MKLQSIFALKWKAFFRSPLLEQIVMFRLLVCLWILALLCLLYMAGCFIAGLRAGSYSTQPLILFSVFSVCISIDFLLKYIFKKPYLHLKIFSRFPESENCINLYLFIKELYSIWNFYLLIFFSPFLMNKIYPVWGLGITLTLFLFLYAIQMFISLLSSKLKEKKAYISGAKYFTSQKIESKSSIASYLVLNLKMTIRSPKLRMQMLLFIILSSVYIYIISWKMNHLL